MGNAIYFYNNYSVYLSNKPFFFEQQCCIAPISVYPALCFHYISNNGNVSCNERNYKNKGQCVYAYFKRTICTVCRNERCANKNTFSENKNVH